MSTPPLYVSVNGQLLPPNQAQLSIFNPAIYGAFGVYESLQLWEGVVFHLEDHLGRLVESAELINLALPASPPLLAVWIEEMVAAHRAAIGAAAETGTIRILALGPGSADAQPHCFIWLQPLRRPTPDEYARGVGAVTFAGERAIPRSKSLNTLVNTLARQQAESRHENEGVLVDRDGNVREGGTSNFCVVQGGTLLVPPPAQILSGVTLQVILSLADAASYPVRRQPIPLATRSQWDEAFLTSTSRHLLPLVRLDGSAIGSGRPGPLTRDLLQRFEAYFSAYVGQRQPSR